MKKENGITLISLVMIIAIMIILTGTTVTTSLNRFKINNVTKMNNDIELLDDKISTYYLKYGGLPILEKYTGELNFETYPIDDENYSIIDLKTLGDLTLNYGKEGYEHPNSSDDVYIINEKSHIVYYVRGTENINGNIHHTINKDTSTNEDNIPPTKPQINIVSGNKIGENQYEANVILEFIPGKDNWSGVSKTTYSINGSNEQDINGLENSQYKISEAGIYEIDLKTYDNNNMMSEEKETIYIGIIKLLEYIKSTGTQCIDTEYVPGLNPKVVMELKFDGTFNNLEEVRIFGAKDTGQNFAVNFGGGKTQGNQIYTWYRERQNNEIYYININDNIRTNRNTLSFGQGEFSWGGRTLSLPERISSNKESLVIMGGRTNGEYQAFGGYDMYLYSCKIYEGEELVRDFIPVLDANKVACLYDKIEGKFYYNQGTDDFKTNLDE